MEPKIDYSKYCFFPIHNDSLYRLYKQQRNAFWTVDEINMIDDRKDWESLNPNEKKFLTFILAFFAQADGIIIENIMENFQKETSYIKEANSFYSMQNAIETIHNETYSVMIETFIQDPIEKNKALNAIQNYGSIKRMADWMRVWMDPKIPIMERIVAFICVEGIFFTGAFCAIYWIKRSNKLNGLCKANEFIARDEALHTRFGIALYHIMSSTKNRLSFTTVNTIINSAIEINETFIRDALCVDLIGMNANDMIKYVKCTADYILDQLGYKRIYNVYNPFDFMNLIVLDNKTNFFEDIVSEYTGPRTNDYTFPLLDKNF